MDHKCIYCGVDFREEPYSAYIPLWGVLHSDFVPEYCVDCVMQEGERAGAEITGSGDGMMKRVTCKNRISGQYERASTALPFQILQRLGEYEDTGLTPDQVRNLLSESRKDGVSSDTEEI